MDCADRVSVPTLITYPSECSPPPVCNGTLTATISLNYAASNVAGAVAHLDYPEASVSIPGTGSVASVLARVTNLTGVSGGLFQVNDTDSLVNVGEVSLGAPIPSGNLAKVVFDCAPGTPVPAASAFVCTPDVSDDGGLDVAATCSIAVQVP